MKCVSARGAKHGFGQMLDTAGAEPAIIEKRGRSAIVVPAIEEYERLVGAGASGQPGAQPTRTRGK
ncbi:MAG: type II toxin-antitoxin system Phd/YefM family antitoxin [Acetobacteraceae bacterium]